MNRQRVQAAIEERTRRMLGFARADIYVSCWDGGDGVQSTQVHLQRSLAEQHTETVREWMAYLDAFAPGVVSIWEGRLQSDIKILD